MSFPTHTPGEIAVIGDWIRREIRPAEEIWWGNSKGLLQLLCQETRMRLSHEDFKEAMQLAGYQPLDPEATCARYHIVLARDINLNPNPFLQWADQFRREFGPRRNFVLYMNRDFGFPVFANHDIIRRYLECRGTSGVLLDTFEDLWQLYEECDD